MSERNQATKLCFNPNPLPPPFSPQNLTLLPSLELNSKTHSLGRELTLEYRAFGIR